MTTPNSPQTHERVNESRYSSATTLDAHPDWATALGETLIKAQGLVEKFYGDGYEHTLPDQHNVLRALRIAPDKVKVVIVGQDPYPTPGDAVGLSFSVSPGTAIPRSLRNIYKEYATDLHLPEPTHGDLSAWESQGVMLLNRVLTVSAGDAGSHRKQGWEEVTLAIIEALIARKQPLVAILWGKDAQTLAPLFAAGQTITSVHPSPLSASRGFFGSKPFTTANALLQAQGATPVNWEIPPTHIEVSDSAEGTLF